MTHSTLNIIISWGSRLQDFHTQVFGDILYLNHNNEVYRRKRERETKEERKTYSWYDPGGPYI
jgi:hypothetical protein